MALKANAGWTGEKPSIQLDLAAARRFLKKDGDTLVFDHQNGRISVETATGDVRELSMDILDQPPVPNLERIARKPRLFERIMKGAGDIELDIGTDISQHDIQETLSTFDEKSELHQANLGIIIGQVYAMKQLGVHTPVDFNTKFSDLRKKPIGVFCKKLLENWEEFFKESNS